jgi:3-hydroxyisobutyrate dehydrogenase-like beta-hydroxyacid dehydrogenase
MGAAMAQRLLDCGANVVVWNRSRAAVDRLAAAGATVAESPQQLVESCSQVMTMLRDDAAAEAVYLGEAGLIGSHAKGCLFLEMSTLRPGTARQLHKRAREYGAAMLDAPVSGTVAPALKGQLVALVGGDAQDLSRAEPILAMLTRRVIHAGPPGQGALLKLVVNLPLAVYWHALSEALELGEAGGLARKLMLETIADSAAAIAVLGLKTPILLGESSEVAFDLVSMCKDLTLITDEATDLGTNGSATAAALQAYLAAVDEGLGEKDVVAIACRRADRGHSRHD